MTDVLLQGQDPDPSSWQIPDDNTWTQHFSLIVGLFEAHWITVKKKPPKTALAVSLT